MAWGRRPGTCDCGSDPFIRALPGKVLAAPPCLQYQLTVLARSVWSIPEMPLIDADQKVNRSASACSTFLTVDCNYEVWASLWSPQPDGISIFQLPNEIRPSLMEAGEEEVHLLEGNRISVKKCTGCPDGCSKHLCGCSQEQAEPWFDSCSTADDIPPSFEERKRSTRTHTLAEITTF